MPTATVTVLRPLPKDILSKDPSEESVYNMVPKQIVVEEKGPLYRSIYAGVAKQEYKKVQKRIGVLGPAHVKRDDPQVYLKKHSADSRLQKQAKQHATKHESHSKNLKNRLPLWEPTKPRAVPITPPSRPKSEEKKEIDYRKKKDYGKVPSYLTVRKTELSEYEVQKRLASERANTRPSDFVPLREEERLKILDGLKSRWSTLMQEYQKLPLVIDTVPKRNRKVALDRELNKIEQDIEKFSHENIHIKLV